jgi:tryptophan synthase alpha chain
VNHTTRIAQTFAQLKTSGKMAFMPFLTAGDPDLDMTKKLLIDWGRRGVDLVEIGFPYSDPIADGAVIQASYTRALAKKITIDQIFAALTELSGEKIPPLVGMVSYSLIFRYGTEKFISGAKRAGISGLIVPDFPGDEAGAFARQVQAAGLDAVQLVAPTTPAARVQKILQSASGFLYCISVAGTTGVRQELPAELSQQLQQLQTQTDLPLAVGFGISRPEQVSVLRGKAHGVIVGSAIVRQLESLADEPNRRDKVIAELGRFVDSMVAATHQA